MSQLEEIRERLDLCDKKIVSVLEERMDIIKEIMVYKKENGLPIFSQNRKRDNVRCCSHMWMRIPIRMRFLIYLLIL